MVYSDIYLNLQSPGVIPYIRVSQLDSGIRSFRFHILDGDVEWTIPSNVSVTMKGTKPDKNGFDYGGEYEGNIVTVLCREQMTAVNGDIRCKLIFVDTDQNRIASFSFFLEVEKDSTDDDTIFSESSIDYANQVITNLQGVGAYGDRLSNLERSMSNISIYYVDSEEQAYFSKG